MSSELGKMYLSQNQIPQAFYYFGHAFAQDNSNTLVLLSLGSICQDFFDSEGALFKYKLFHGQDPNSSEVWNNIGMCYFERGNYISVGD